MKKISILIQMFCVILVISSCTDDNANFKITETTPVVLSNLAISDIELDQVNPNNPAVTLNWTPANYGQQTAVFYNVQLSSDAAFTNPVSVTTVSSNSATLSINQLNSAVGSAGLPPFQWNAVYARVVSTIGTTASLPVASNTITFNVYPYFNYPFKDYYIVGNATEPGWNNNNNNPPLFRDGSNPNLYRYAGYFDAGEFKVLEEKGLWQPQWGTNGGGGINVNPGGGSDPGTFPNNNSAIASAGYYTFTINYSTNSFLFVPLSTAGAVNFSSITIQGTSAASTPMIQSTFDNHIWHKNTLHLTPGDLKFVTNTGSVWGGSTSFSGTATVNGANIPVIVEDDYDVWFNDLTGHYILIPLNL
ncbi:SusE domain-containing protein [Flavobacterium sp.]|uniref:SusE domain-containing protein n=1 Tax=Flavobacterium sp. TaxID=239 RepID=UPI0025D20739|nr:SusE domain-containing protein [Flavobacterium sp.]